MSGLGPASAKKKKMKIPEIFCAKFHFFSGPKSIQEVVFRSFFPRHDSKILNSFIKKLMLSLIISVDGSVAYTLQRETTQLISYQAYARETTQSPDSIMLEGNANHIL